MTKEEYAMIAKIYSERQCEEETPEGQKFHIGEIVRIVNPRSWFARMNEGCIDEIKYSYAQKFGGDDVKQYSLRKGGAWYDEEELELVKSIAEIKEENDLLEYKRLKKKYEKIK